jgi:hypothetical protein
MAAASAGGKLQGFAKPRISSGQTAKGRSQMAALSISRAWDETKARIASDGRLMTVVAAALIALPQLVTGAIMPSTAASGASLTEGLMILVASLIAVIGQLAVIRLAIGQSISVGDAIAHGARRMPIYVVACIIILAGLVIAAIPFIVVMALLGVPLGADAFTTREAIANSPVVLLLACLYFALVIVVGIRMLMSSPVASEEAVGPVAILRRSWELTAGNWWRLFGFIIIFFIGAGIAMMAVNWAVGLVAISLFGPVEPMSASALLVALVDAIVNAAMTTVLAVLLARIYVQLSGRESPVSVPKSGT